MEHDLNILMIFGINFNFESYNVLLTKYSCAAYDCFCAAGSDITVNVMNTLYRYRLYIDYIDSC